MPTGWLEKISGRCRASSMSSARVRTQKPPCNGLQKIRVPWMRSNGLKQSGAFAGSPWWSNSRTRSGGTCTGTEWVPGAVWVIVLLHRMPRPRRSTSHIEHTISRLVRPPHSPGTCRARPSGDLTFRPQPVDGAPHGGLDRDGAVPENLAGVRVVEGRCRPAQPHEPDHALAESRLHLGVIRVRLDRVEPVPYAGELAGEVEEVDPGQGVLVAERQVEVAGPTVVDRGH